MTPPATSILREEYEAAVAAGFVDEALDTLGEELVGPGERAERRGRMWTINGAAARIWVAARLDDLERYIARTSLRAGARLALTVLMRDRARVRDTILVTERRALPSSVWSPSLAGLVDRFVEVDVQLELWSEDETGATSPQERVVEVTRDLDAFEPRDLASELWSDEALGWRSDLERGDFARAPRPLASWRDGAWEAEGCRARAVLSYRFI